MNVSKTVRNGFIAVAAAVLFLASVDPTPALAHANVESSVPAANSVVPESPGQVTVRFTEPVEPTLTSLQVLNTAGQAVDSGDTRVSESDRTVVSVTVRPLDDGTYTVAWRNVSAIDGHPVRGSFIFSVGFPTISGAPTKTEQPPILTSKADPWARWGAIASVLGLFGGLVLRVVFELTVARGFRPSRGRLDGGEVFDLERARRRSDIAIWAMLLLAIAGSIAHVAVVTATTYQVGLGAVASGDVLRLVQDTFWGRVWLARMCVLIAVAILLALATRIARNVRTTTNTETNTPDLPEPRPLWPRMAALLLLSAGAVTSLSLVSHGAAAGEIGRLAIITDLLHAFAAAIWIGGLLQLAVLLSVLVRSESESIRSGLLPALVPNFSVIAGLSFGVLLITGIFEAYAQVTAVDAATTPYGYALLAKLAVIVPLAGLAAVNLLRISPMLGGHAGARRFLARVVWVEVGLGAFVLLAVAFMTAMEPARQTRSRELASAPGIEFEDRAEGTRIVASLQPGTVGDNSVVVHLNDRAGRPIENATSVNARMRYLNQDLGESLVAGLDHGDGIWVVHSIPVPITGPWQLEVLVQRPDAFDANLAWRVGISSTAGQRSNLKPVPATARLLFGLQIALIGLLAAGIAVVVGGWGSIRGRVLSATGVVAVIAGALLVLNSGTLSQDGGLPQVNPVPRVQASVDAGRRIYVTDCQTCHGESGTGNGPARSGLPTAPADLTIHVPLHGDRELFRFIHDGLTTMRAYGDRLSDEEIWHVVNYIRTLANEAANPAEVRSQQGSGVIPTPISGTASTSEIISPTSEAMSPTAVLPTPTLLPRVSETPGLSPTAVTAAAPSPTVVVLTPTQPTQAIETPTSIPTAVPSPMPTATVGPTATPIPTPAFDPEQTFVVVIEAGGFSPDHAHISKGMVVLWKNTDLTAHTVTRTGSDEPWDTGPIGPGESASRRFDVPGFYEYFCKLHPEMQAGVFVTP